MTMTIFLATATTTSSKYLILCMCNFYFQTCLTFELNYNAPDGSVGTWQRQGFSHLEQDTGGIGTGSCGMMESDDRKLLGGASDTDSATSSPSRSFKGSRISIASKVSQPMRSSNISGWVVLIQSSFEYLRMNCPYPIKSPNISCWLVTTSQDELLYNSWKWFIYMYKDYFRKYFSC